MHKVPVFLLCWSLAALAGGVPATDRETRIIGGTEVDIGSCEYLVSVRYKESPDGPFRHKCAGIIYNDRFIITAAQCITSIGASERVMIVTGANTRTGADGRPYPVAKWIVHPSFSFWTFDYDIGLLVLDYALPLGEFGVRSIAIQERRPAVGKVGTIAGWGYREEFGPSSYNLEATQVPIISTHDCNAVYGEGEITDRMICAGYVVSGGKDACHGDTGGPLVVDERLVGLVSWGRGCARPGYPGVYTFVGSLKTWIDETIAANV